MEVDPINPARNTEKVLAAWLAAREALEAVAPPTSEAGTPQGAAATRAQHDPTIPVSEPTLPGVDSDATHEAATVQTAWRAPTPAADVPRRADESAASVPAAQGDLAVPDSLLAPAMLTGLQVDPSFAWPRQPMPGWQQIARDGERREPPREQDDHHEPSPEDEAEAAPEPVSRQPHRERPAPAPLAGSGAWAEALSRSLRRTLASHVVPQALLTAADQWQRGRCVVLACPQGVDPAGPAWAFVLWPMSIGEHTEHGVTQPLELRGLQVEASLQWSAPPRTGQWCHARVVKEHHPRTGRQLVAIDDATATERGRPLPCEVQLGPVLARSLRWCEVRVRIQAAQRFWNALGTQWSVHVVVSAEPLIPPPAPTRPEGSPC